MSKNPEIEKLLDAIAGGPGTRATAKKDQKCLPPPIGCGGPADSFRNEQSEREYEISRLCQKCQDDFFGGG